jgi:hypothetical protein
VKILAGRGSCPISTLSTTPSTWTALRLNSAPLMETAVTLLEYKPVYSIMTKFGLRYKNVLLNLPRSACCGYEVPGMILLRHLFVVKTCLCMLQVGPLTISTH